MSSLLPFEGPVLTSSSPCATDLPLPCAAREMLEANAIYLFLRLCLMLRQAGSLLLSALSPSHLDILRTQATPSAPSRPSKPSSNSTYSAPPPSLLPAHTTALSPGKTASSPTSSPSGTVKHPVLAKRARKGGATPAKTTSLPNPLPQPEPTSSPSRRRSRELVHTSAGQRQSASLP